MVLSSKSEYANIQIFLEDHVTGVMMVKFSFEITGIKLHFKIYSNQKQLLFQNMFIVKTFFYCFCCTLEQINAGLVNRR